MDYLIGGAVILLLLLLVGVSGVSLATGLLSLAALVFMVCAGIVLFLMTLFFAGAALLLLRAQRTAGVFQRFDKEKRFEHAVFLSDGRELGITFPAETVMRGRIYTDKPARLFIAHIGGKELVFDHHSAVIILCGLALSAASLAGFFCFVFFVILF